MPTRPPTPTLNTSVPRKHSRCQICGLEPSDLETCIIFLTFPIPGTLPKVQYLSHQMESASNCSRSTPPILYYLSELKNTDCFRICHEINPLRSLRRERAQLWTEMVCSRLPSLRLKRDERQSCNSLALKSISLFPICEKNTRIKSRWNTFFRAASLSLSLFPLLHSSQLPFYKAYIYISEME